MLSNGGYNVSDTCNVEFCPVSKDKDKDNFIMLQSLGGFLFQNISRIKEKEKKKLTFPRSRFIANFNAIFLKKKKRLCYYSKPDKFLVSLFIWIHVSNPEPLFWISHSHRISGENHLNDSF